MPRRRPAAALAACFVAHLFVLGAVVAPALAAQDEGELLKQIKTDVFDQRWDGVLTSCTQFITQYPRSLDLPRVYYYKAQALEHSKGREAEAITAYTDYVTRFPNEKGALHEDALLKRISLATALYLKGVKTHIGVILQAMDEKGYTRIFAAIQASKLDHGPARAKALPILIECGNTETDPEVRNECLLGVLRIDPQKAGQVSGPKNDTGGPAAGPARLIRVEVFDKLKKQVAVRVNMPMSFIDILFDSLGEEIQKEIGDEMKKKGIQLERILESIKKHGPQTIIEIDNDEQHIKVWVE